MTGCPAAALAAIREHQLGHIDTVECAARIADARLDADAIRAYLQRNAAAVGDHASRSLIEKEQVYELPRIVEDMLAARTIIDEPPVVFATDEDLRARAERLIEVNPDAVVAFIRHRLAVALEDETLEQLGAAQLYRLLDAVDVTAAEDARQVELLREMSRLSAEIGDDQ